METLEGYRDRDDLRLEDLLAAANRLLPEVAPEQPHGKTTERLDERTVRYYQSEGVVDRPTGYAGTAALYTYRHLLQLLAIKRLQSQGLPLRAIRGLVPGHSEWELEAILGMGGGAVAVAEAAPESDPGDYLRGLLLRKAARGAPSPPPAPAVPPPSAAAPPPAPAPGARLLRARPPAAEPAPLPAHWQRIVVEDGLELHVAEEFTPPSTPEGRRRLAERLAAILAHLTPKGRTPR